MKKLFILLITVIAFSTLSFGQQMMFQKNNYRHAIYKPGDKLAFRLKDDKRKFHEPIKGFKDNHIVFEDFTVHPKEISHLYVDDKTKDWFVFRYKYFPNFTIAGFGYMAIDLVNNGKLHRETLMVGSALIGMGVAAKLLISKKIKIKGKKKIIIMDYPKPQIIAEAEEELF